MNIGKQLTVDQMAELERIRARQAYGIHRGSDYNREAELTRTIFTQIGEGALLAVCFVLGYAPFVLMGAQLWQMIFG